MVRVEVYRGGVEVARIEFSCSLPVVIPGGNGATRSVPPSVKETTGVRFLHGSVPQEVVDEIFLGLCHNKVTDTVFEYTWRA